MAEAKPQLIPIVEEAIVYFPASSFSQPWNDSDVVLVVEGKEFHVHRCILSLQSPVFKAMLNGNFKDATQDKIELKDENHKAMFQFLKLLYPQNMLHGFCGKGRINDENIIDILKLADKYAAINIIKQCVEEISQLNPENTMRLLPYAVRYEVPTWRILEVIARHVSTKELKIFAPELSNDSVYAQTLAKKCYLLESAVRSANVMILNLLEEIVNAGTSTTIYSDGMPTKCIQHPERTVHIKNFTNARNCTNCLAVYKKCLIDQYVFQSSQRDNRNLMNLLKLMDDIVTSLQLNTQRTN